MLSTKHQVDVGRSSKNEREKRLEVLLMAYAPEPQMSVYSSLSSTKMVGSLARRRRQRRYRKKTDVPVLALSGDEQHVGER